MSLNPRPSSAFAAALACTSLVAALAWPVASQAPLVEGDEPELPGRAVVIDVDAPERSLYRIAVPDLRGDEALGEQGAAVLRNDLRLVSLFELLDEGSFVANLEAEGLELVPAAWQTIGAQGVVKGEVTRDGTRIRLELRLYELARGATPTLTRAYSGSAEELRQFMHLFGNDVLLTLTGRAGAFGTRLAFARRYGPGRKDIMIAGFDGDRLSRISSGNGIAMLPSFGRGGLWYSVLTEEGMYLTRTGLNERAMVRSEGLNMGVSVCGDRMYFTSTRDGNAEIYSADLSGGGIERLTNHPAIDVSPTCGGPGGRIAFVSNRHGGPQIFTMSPNGGDVTRVTYRGNHNQTPAWCPVAEDGPLLAFTGLSGNWDIFTVNLRTQQYTRLTQGQGTNKDPAFSPDCRMVAFYSSRGGIFISSPQGSNQNLVIPGHAETLRWGP
jgi:TolB protein